MFFEMHSKEKIDLVKQKPAEKESVAEDCRKNEFMQTCSTVHDKRQLKSKEMQDRSQTSNLQNRKI